MLDPALYRFFMIFGTILMLINLFVLICHLVPLRTVYIPKTATEGARVAEVSEERNHPAVKEKLRKRRRVAAISLMLTLVFAGYFLWTEVSGENRLQNEVAIQARMELIEDEYGSYFIELTEDQLRSLAAGEITDLPVVFEDGTLRDVSFSYSFQFRLAGFALLPQETVKPLIVKDSSWVIPAEQQRIWLLQASVVELVNERYGIPLTGDQVEALQVPAEAPSGLTRYGTIPLTLPGSGGYSNIEATLIWDNGFKLIGIPEGGTVQEELPRSEVPGE